MGYVRFNCKYKMGVTCAGQLICAQHICQRGHVPKNKYNAKSTFVFLGIVCD